MLAGLALATVAVTAPAPVAVGEAMAISVTITPAAGEVISKDGPVILDLSVDDGAGIAPYRYRYWRKDAADPQASAPRFVVRARAVRAGTWKVRLELLFWTCKKKTCVPIETAREVSVVVTEKPGAGERAGPGESRAQYRKPARIEIVRFLTSAASPSSGSSTVISPKL